MARDDLGSLPQAQRFEPEEIASPDQIDTRDAAVPLRGDGERVEISAEEAFQWALALHRDRRYTPAEQLYQKFLSYDPDHVDANQFLGLLLHQTARSDAGLGHLQRAVSLDPHNAGLWLNCGNVLAERGDADGAAAAYGRALSLAPGLAAALANRGVVHRAAGRIEAAEKDYRDALAADPQNYEALNNLGNLLTATGRAEEAIECARNAQRLRPRGATGRRLLGRALEAAGRPERAREVYADWLKSEPNNPFAQHLLAAIDHAPPPRCSDAFVKATFEETAASFDRTLSALDYRGPQLIERTLREHLPNAADLTVLDAGCGTGLCAAVLRPIALRLTAVDLSGDMLRLAADRALYDDLFEGEVTSFMAAHPEAFDLVCAGDVLCYFGDLEPFARAARGALRPGGLLVATSEAWQGPGRFRLSTNGRYAHTRDYLATALAGTGFVLSSLQQEVLRSEYRMPVDGFIFAARKI